MGRGSDDIESVSSSYVSDSKVYLLGRKRSQRKLNKSKKQAREDMSKGKRTQCLTQLPKFLFFATVSVLLGWLLVSSLAINFRVDLQLVSFNNVAQLETFFTAEIEPDEVPEGAVTEEDPYAAVDLSQQLGTNTRKRISIEDEKKIACKENKCVEKCYNKISSKCLANESCLKAKLRDCKRGCRKDRCTQRCEIEPPLGYVEREMKLDSCKDECKGSSKCLSKCDFKFMPCRTKCKTFLAKKYTCDTELKLEQYQKDVGQTESMEDDLQEEFDFTKEIENEINGEEI